MSELEPLPPDLRALLADEREAYPDDSAARARVRRRIEASVAFGAVGVAAGLTAASKMGLLSSLGMHGARNVKLWLALSLATGIVVGETHARVSAPPPPPPPPPPLPVVVAAQPVPVASAPALEVAPAIPIASLPSLPSAAPAPASVSPSNLSVEQSLIDTARSALARGRGDDALRATEDHARLFPRGRLAEEREALAIQALLLVSRRAEASTRADRFHKAYPGSLYGNAVDVLLAPREDGGR